MHKYKKSNKKIKINTAKKKTHTHTKGPICVLASFAPILENWNFCQNQQTTISSSHDPSAS